jgi:hypothetical protein
VLLEREREGGGGEEKNEGFVILWMMVVGVLTGYFSPYLICCDYPNCPILVGGYIRVGEVI